MSRLDPRDPRDRSASASFTLVRALKRQRGVCTSLDTPPVKILVGCSVSAYSCRRRRTSPYYRYYIDSMLIRLIALDFNANRSSAEEINANYRDNAGTVRSLLLLSLSFLFDSIFSISRVLCNGECTSP